MTSRDLAKALGRGVALLAVSPLLISYRFRSALLGADRALFGSSQLLSLVPGLTGQYLRRAFLSRVLQHCSGTAAIEFGAIFSQVGARIDENVYVGPYCHIGLAHLERNVLLAPGVHVPSGPNRHGISDTLTPIRDQPGTLRIVTVGEGTWVGSGAVLLADVGCHTVVAAGAVVTKPIPDLVIAAGVPARVVRSRLSATNPDSGALETPDAAEG